VTFKKYRVFVASPGDVRKERAIAREVILDLSHTLGDPSGFVLEPVGWETHAEPGVGRPQALINPLVRKCDVFVGIVWARLGTQTGEAESGTVEEFELARGLNRRSRGRPAILMFFSDVAVPRQLLRTKEGKEQFEKAEHFRSDFEQSVGLAVPYTDPEEFRDQLRKHLEAWCARLSPFGGSTRRVPRDDGQAERDYRDRLANHHRNMTAIGFETGLQVPIPLQDVYVPTRARVEALEVRHGRSGNRLGAEATRTERCDDFREIWRLALDRDIRTVVLLGQPGSGKTTLLRHLVPVTASGAAPDLGLPRDVLPVFVPLRQLDVGAGLGFGATLCAASDPSLSGLPESLLDGPLKDERCLLLLDGLDEVADAGERREVSRWVEALVAQHPRNHVVLTARYAGYRDAPLRAGHLQVDVQPFIDDDIARFIRCWYRAVAKVLEGGTSSARERADRSAADLTRAIEAHGPLRQLASNPLLVQIIALVHRSKGSLPEKRVALYEECTTVLLESWDRAKGLFTGLTAREARQVLQPLALWMHGEENRVYAREEAVVPLVESQLRRLRKPMEATAFLHSVRDRSGLLTGHGLDLYGFPHLSFQEYLAAEEIRNTGRLEVLVEHYDESWWREATRLFVGLGNPNLFEPLVRALAGAGRLGGHEAFTGECIRDALLAGPEVFLEALSEQQERAAPESERRALLLALRNFSPDQLMAIAGPLREALARECSAELRTLLQALLAATGAIEYAASETSRRNAVDGMELVLIPGGPFRSGSADFTDNPPRVRDLGDFYLGRYPVTNAQYALYLEAHPEATKPTEWENDRFNGREQPVVGVSWHEAVVYCEWAGLRLPTEWEWEKGARGTDGREYPWGPEEPDAERASFGRSAGQPSPVGSHPAGASPYGLQDMAGNVWEWTASDYSEGLKTLRGGSFGPGPQSLRAADRCVIVGRDFDFLGFRCAQDP
jgi:formylglycine-generating enzyme required for sulfatase activity